MSNRVLFALCGIVGLICLALFATTPASKAQETKAECLTIEMMLEHGRNAMKEGDPHPKYAYLDKKVTSDIYDFMAVRFPAFVLPYVLNNYKPEQGLLVSNDQDPGFMRFFFVDTAHKCEYPYIIRFSTDHPVIIFTLEFDLEWKILKKQKEA